MPIDLRAEYNSLLESSKLDELLNKAKKQAAKVAVVLPADQALENLNAEVSAMDQKSAEARQDLIEILQKRNEERAVKVATAVHIYRVATRLVS